MGVVDLVDEVDNVDNVDNPDFKLFNSKFIIHNSLHAITLICSWWKPPESRRIQAVTSRGTPP